MLAGIAARQDFPTQSSAIKRRYAAHVNQTTHAALLIIKAAGQERLKETAEER
jgi:hypothetical protein